MSERMQNSPLFSADSVLFNVNAGSQKQLFQELANALIKVHHLDKKDISCSDIVNAAIDREHLGSTGVGNGVALPHARIEGVDKVTAVFAKLSQPLEFDAIDDRDVDLVVFLLAPSNAGGAHLRALAKVSRLLRRPNVRARLREAPSSEALYTILTETQDAKAA